MSVQGAPSPTLLMPPPSTTIMIRKRDPLPTTSLSPSSPGDSDGDEGEEEYRPVASSSKRPHASASGSRRPIAPKSAQQGSNGRQSTKQSREALRKANHSLIERRRREKINFALGELREMVPGLGDEKGGKAGEFKLEVLERTVIHMRELKAHIAKLEKRVSALGGEPIKQESSHVACDCSEDDDQESALAPAPIRFVKRKLNGGPSTTPPSPSSSPDRRPITTSLHGNGGSMMPNKSPDPNETDAESNLPPPLTIASRSLSGSSSSSNPSSGHHPSITSLLNSANRPPQQPASRPAPPPQAANPTLYLPFPTPSPTSPFLTYPSGTSSSSVSTSTIEPSPFMAPLQNFSLFGGALSLDHSPAHLKHASGSRSPPDLSMPPPPAKAVPSSEEAANLLLAFSSPDTLRPVSGGMPVHRESEDHFTLDGGHDTSAPPAARKREGGHGHGQWGRPVAGKTARDILRM